MKFATLFAFLAAAVHASVDVAPANRALQKNYYIDSAEVGDSPLPFEITYKHEDMSSGVTRSLKILPGACPGAAGFDDDAGVDGVTLVSLDVSSDDETVATIDVEPTGGPWADGATVIVPFCAWLGAGDSAIEENNGNDIYGFFEVEITATFVFDGDWECQSFETQAKNPVTSETKKTIGTEVTPCDDMPDPLFPGQIACFLICPVAYTEDGEDAEDSDKFCLITEDFAIDDEKCPSPCNEGTDVTEWGQYTATEDGETGCITVEFNIPLSYHTFTVAKQTLYVKGTTSFRLCADESGNAVSVVDETCAYGAKISTPCGVGWRADDCTWDADNKVCIPKVRRLANLNRKLQENDVARINSQVEFTTAPIEESSSNVAMAGFAAAAAVGAALLI